jgi:adenylate cyclase
LARSFLTGEAATVRVRRAGDRACVTVKGRGQGISRPEFEYLIPTADAEELLQMCSKPLIEKVRYSVPHGRHVWSVDVFRGSNAGLILAEIELSRPDEATEKASHAVDTLAPEARDPVRIDASSEGTKKPSRDELKKNG